MNSSGKEHLTKTSKENTKVIEALRKVVRKLSTPKNSHQPFCARFVPYEEEGRVLSQFNPVMQIATAIIEIFSLKARDCLKDGVIDLKKLIREVITLVVEAFGDEVLPKSKPDSK